jgi:hypothetical protein
MTAAIYLRSLRSNEEPATRAILPLLPDSPIRQLVTGAELPDALTYRVDIVGTDFKGDNEKYRPATIRWTHGLRRGFFA